MIWTQIGNKFGVLRYWNEFDIFMDDVPWQIRKLENWIHRILICIFILSKSWIFIQNLMWEN
jgi:hypothetical protein